MRPTKRRAETLRNELQRLFARAKMPSSPALASQILRLIDDPKSDASGFGAVIRTDPGLSARLLKTANTVHFAQRNPVTTVERAVTVLGLSRIKTISLGFQLVSHLDRLGGAPFDMKAFWQHSLLRACLARSIAQTAVPEREGEAFLVGLLQECGILLLVQFLGCGYASAYRSNLSPAAFHAVERESFPHTHIEAISVMASEWTLPKIIAVPLERHHERTRLSEEPSEMERLSAISYFVGALRFVSNLTVDPEEQTLREFGAAALGLDETAWAQAQSSAADEYQRLVTLYGDVLPEDVDVPELLNEANRQLASAADDADQRVLDVESERDAIHREQQRLENSLGAYRERAALDPLTNVLNRGALADVARKAIERSLDEGTPIGALFIDLDNFKSWNDTYGHKVGDNVLRSVAALLRRELGHAGTIGRYGGEEFVVILPQSTADATRRAAEHVVRQVRKLDSSTFGVPGNVTCSVGGIWFGRVPTTSAEELFAAADQVMYKAKRSGKDRYSFESLPEREDARHRDHRTASDEPTPQTLGQPGKSGEHGAQLEAMTAVAGRLNSEETRGFTGIRKEERKKAVLPCVVHHFTGTGVKMRAECAVARNISTGGVGLLMPRPMVRGEAAEVVLQRGESKLYLAGLVTFCRHIERGIHEVGIQFVSHDVTPVISSDALGALHKFDWVAQALNTKAETEAPEEGLTVGAITPLQ